MRVMLVGSGAREHALALAIAASPLCEKLVIAPGNPGMRTLGALFDIAANDIEGLCTLAQQEAIDLVVVGPELPLALGLSDALARISLSRDSPKRVSVESSNGNRHRNSDEKSEHRECGNEDRNQPCRITCFGPSAAAARIESSKAFAKAFMMRHGIPTAMGTSFSNSDEAKAWARSYGKPLVVKASGLAAGKGVVVPESLEAMFAAIDMLACESEIVLEEQLKGEELSIIAICDGKDYAVLPAARDHKRLSDGDRGPNTGGMGAYAPACSQEEAEASCEACDRSCTQRIS